MSLLSCVFTPPPAPVLRLTEFRHWPSPYGPDPYVFGPQYDAPGILGTALRTCPCGVRWAGEPGSPCWACAREVAG